MMSRQVGLLQIRRTSTSEHVALRLLLLEAVVTLFVTGFGMSPASVM